MSIKIKHSNDGTCTVTISVAADPHDPTNPRKLVRAINEQLRAHRRLTESHQLELIRSDENHTDD